MKNGDKPINPIYGADNKLFLSNGKEDFESFNKACRPISGLTKREYFAAMAMQGLLSQTKLYDSDIISNLTSDAVGFADELLRQLELCETK